MENALENQVVLSTIFNYCNVEDLRAVRRVSKSWLNESLPIWRRKTAIRMSESAEGFIISQRLKNKQGDYYKKIHADDDEKGEDVSFEDWRNWTTLDEFLDYVEDSGRSGTETAPFRNFKIHLSQSAWEKEDEASAAVDIFASRLWQVCGPHMKHLEVSSYLQRHCAKLRDILLGPTTPRLEAVFLESSDVYRKDKAPKPRRTSVKQVYYAPKPTVKSFEFVWNGVLARKNGELMARALKVGDIDDRRTQLPFTWEEMFTCFNNLERLSINLDLHNRLMQETILAPLRTLKTFVNQGMLGKLEHLSFERRHRQPDDNVVVREVLKIFGETRIRLRSLKLGWEWESWNGDSSLVGVEYYQLLEKQKNSLERLDVVEFTTPDDGILPRGVIFPNLNTLVMVQAQFEGMGFFKNAPNVKVVRVSGVSVPPGFSEAKDFICFDKATSTSTGVKQPYKDELPVCEDLKELVCTKVCTLKELLQLTVQMPNLEVLEMPLENCALQLVCQKWTKLHRLTILEHPLGVVTDAGVIGCWDSPWPSVPPASIRDLKDLCSLKCASVFGYPDRKQDLTFASLFHGMFQLPRLCYLELKAQLSEQQVEELFHRVPLCVLRNNNLAKRLGMWDTVTNIWRE